MKNYTVFRVRFVRKNDFGKVMAEAERGENYDRVHGSGVKYEAPPG